MNDLTTEFLSLHKEIQSAIASQQYDRAIQLDGLRVQTLQELCLLDMQSIDRDVFDLMEECARQNSEMINIVENDIEALTQFNSRFSKAKRAYFNLA